MPGSRKTERTVLAVFGSPRPEGNSARLHESFLAELHGVTVTRLHVYGMDLRPCTACGHCRGEFGCIHDDDMSGLYGAIGGCDLLSISSPLYFSSLPAPLKAFVDRCQVFWELSERAPEKIRKKRGLFIAVGGADYQGMFDPAVTVMRHFYNTVGCEFIEEDCLLVRGVDGDGAVMPGGALERARALGIQYSAMLDGEK